MIQDPNRNHEAKSFVLEFVAYSRICRNPIEPEWNLSMENYLVIPPNTMDSSNPLSIIGKSGNKILRARESVLVDPETNQMVDTIVANMASTLFFQRDFIKARRVSTRNTGKAKTSTDLLKYALRLDPHFSETILTLKDSVIYGTGILEGYWCTEQGVRTYRNYGPGGVTEMEQLPELAYNDVKFRRVNLKDFFPDHSQTNIADMCGCARRIKMTAGQARDEANRQRDPNNPYDHYGFDPAAVEEAIKLATPGASSEEMSDKAWSPENPQMSNQTPPRFKQMHGYRYYGRIPFESGEAWGVVTVLNGVTVQNDEWYLGEHIIPIFDMRPCTVGDRFWGISKPVAMRYLQDAANFALTTTKEMALRMTKPLLVYNIMDRFNMAKVRLGDPNQPVGLSHPAELQNINYQPNIQVGFQLLSMLKQGMREGSGALGSLQGLGIGTNRKSGTEAANIYSSGGLRPELMSRMLEENCFPRWGKWTLMTYQHMLTQDQELIDRIGPVDSHAPLAEIDGTHDVEFLGSRKVADQQKRIQFAPQVASLLNTPAAVKLDQDEFLRITLEDMGYEDIQIGDPETIAKNIAIAQQTQARMAQANGNGANAPVGPEPGMSPEQAAGTTIPGA